MSASSNPLDHYPAATPPNGVTPNFVDPPSKGREIEILDGIFTGLMLLAVLVRLVVRIKITKQWGWDDLTCSLAAVRVFIITSITITDRETQLGSLAHLIIYTQTIRLVGFGRHMWNIPVSWILIKRNTQLLSSNGIIYPFTIFFAKLSILLLCLRIFSVNKMFKRIVYCGVVILALFYTAMIGVAIASIVNCNGTAAGTLQFCENYSGPVVMLNAVFNVVSDFWVLILPFPQLLKLQLRFRQKIGLTIVFAAGLAACATSLARMIEYGINYEIDDVLWVQAINAEFTFVSFPARLTSRSTIVEMNVGIIVACVSTFPICFANVKMYVHSATASLRTLLASSSGKESAQRTSRLPKDSLLQTHESMNKSGDHSNQYLELQDVAPPTKWAGGTK